MPLFGLEQTVIEATCGMNFFELQALYDRMVWVDTREEATRFMLDVQALIV